MVELDEEVLAVGADAQAVEVVGARLVGDLIGQFFSAYRSLAAGGEGFVPLDDGLAIMSRHARDLGYDGVVITDDVNAAAVRNTPAAQRAVKVVAAGGVWRAALFLAAAIALLAGFDPLAGGLLIAGLGLFAGSLIQAMRLSRSTR